MRDPSEVIAVLRSIAAAIAKAGIDGFGNQVSEQADRLESLSTPQPASADVVPYAPQTCRVCGQPTMHIGDLCFSCTKAVKGDSHAG